MSGCEKIAYLVSQPLTSDAGTGLEHRRIISRMTHPNDLTVRTAQRDDIAAVVALVESAYRGESGLRGWTTETQLLDGQRTDPDDVGDAISRPGSRLLLAERDGILIASCHLEQRGEEAYFGMFAVDPEAQGAGLGKRLLALAENTARNEWHCASITMTVIEQRHELIAWYERRGYALTGEFAPFPYGDERFGIPRRDDLRFAVLRKPLDGENR